jgi:hypothetical protein
MRVDNLDYPYTAMGIAGSVFRIATTYNGCLTINQFIYYFMQILFIGESYPVRLVLT